MDVEAQPSRRGEGVPSAFSALAMRRRPLPSMTMVKIRRTTSASGLLMTRRTWGPSGSLLSGWGAGQRACLANVLLRCAQVVHPVCASPPATAEGGSHT
jgi:hypothetical protein